MDYRKDNSQLAPKVDQQPQQCNRIRASGNRNAYTVSGPEQIIFADIGKYRLGKLVHGSMLHLDQPVQLRIQIRDQPTLNLA